MKFKAEDLRDFIFEEVGDKFEMVEEGNWVDDDKYSEQTIIFKFEGKFYKVEHSRSGSYYSEYHYECDDWRGDVECPEVEKVEVVKHEWREKK